MGTKTREEQDIEHAAVINEHLHALNQAIAAASQVGIETDISTIDVSEIGCSTRRVLVVANLLRRLRPFDGFEGR